MGEGEWVWDWFDDSPRGETYGVRRADEVLCYTNRFKAGFDDAQRIAICMNICQQLGWPMTARQAAEQAKRESDR